MYQVQEFYIDPEVLYLGMPPNQKVHQSSVASRVLILKILAILLIIVSTVEIPIVFMAIIITSISPQSTSFGARLLSESSQIIAIQLIFSTYFLFAKSKKRVELLLALLLAYGVIETAYSFITDKGMGGIGGFALSVAEIALIYYVFIKVRAVK